MIQDSVQKTEQRLGFPHPPTRLPFETFRTDYGLGLCGLAWVMQIMHLPAYRAARLNLAAGCEINEQRIREVQQSLQPLPRITRDLGELIRDERVDVIDCCFGHDPGKQENRLRAVRLAAEAGKPIMIHKPMATSVEFAVRLIDAARDGGIPLAVNQDCRYNPANYAVKHLLSDERLGRPMVVEVGSYWRGGMPNMNDMRPAHLSHVIHHADLIRWWVGSPCRSVYARSRGNTSLIVYEFEDGTIARHTEGHNGVGAHDVEVAITAERGVTRGGHNWNWHLASAHAYDRVTVYPGDTRGRGVDLVLPEHIYEPPWSLVNPYIPHQGPYYDLGAPIAGMMGSMGSLMQAMDTGQAPDNSADSALESLKMCLAAERSAREGRPIDPAEL